MEPESEEIEVNQVPRAFFEGLARAPKLTQKQAMLRQTIKEGSRMESKQTTLQEKIGKVEQQRKRTIQVEELDDNVFREKVIVDQSSQPKKKKENKNLLTLQPGQRSKTFEDLRLTRPLLKAINDLGYSSPTPIQQLAVPVIASGKDIVASSITGSGKTAAFLMPIIQRYFNVAAVGYIRALIVTPTRQLAIQIYEQFEKLNKYAKLEAALVIGASSIQKQEMSLRNNPELVIGTPGRIIDLLLNSRSVGIQNLEMLIFDEADKLLELGFESQIKEIMKYVSDDVQTLMFSATMGRDLDRLAHFTTKKPIRLSADPDNVTIPLRQKTAEKLHQQIVKLKEDTEQYREAVLISVLSQLYKDKVIVFFKTKKQCHRVAIILGLLGLRACELHGNLSQTQRIEAFMDFKEGKYDYLLATDLASRGLDIKEVQTVVNFELPTHLTKYIHRIGRTARAGSVGTSLTLCNDSESLQIKKMSRRTGDKLFKLNINDQAVQTSQRSISRLRREIEVIMGEEREQRDIRKAQMELKKLENINEHQNDIYSRPKKEWFITQNEKKKIQEKAKEINGQVIVQKKQKKTKQIFKRNHQQGQKRENYHRQNQKRGGFKGKNSRK